MMGALRDAPSEAALTRAEWQEVMFAARPRRPDLMRLRAAWPLQPLRVSVMRNHAVEATLAAMRAFLAYAGFAMGAVLSEYDDALSLPPLADADVHLIWLDATRFSDGGGDVTTMWFSERLATLRGLLRGPILVVDTPDSTNRTESLNAALRDIATRLPDVHVVPLSNFLQPLGSQMLEHRVGSMGTRLSREATMLAAQHLGLQWIPAVRRPRLKVVVVDLDDTLVGGVLGEGGVRALRTDGAYAALHDRLLALHRDGLLLALVSKNDAGDLERLFAERPELSDLRGAFVAIEAGWQEKAASVAAIAQRIRVGTDAMLIVDDNPGEVAAMAAQLEGAWFLVAQDPATTARALSLHPGLLTLRPDEEVRGRREDIISAVHREAEAKRFSDPLAYLSSLRIRIQLSMDARQDRARLSELSRKTNQFNTALRRLSEAEVDEYIHSTDRCAVSVRLEDRLSDSGHIGAIFARRHKDSAIIDEIAISCRALGRYVEDAFLAEAMSGIARTLGVQRVVVPFVPGPRNEPAARWLEAAGERLQDGGYDLTDYGSHPERVPSRTSFEMWWETRHD